MNKIFIVKCEIFNFLDLFNFIDGSSKIQNGEETSTYESVIKSIRSDPKINELLTRTIDTYESIIKLTRSDTIINDLLTRVIAGYERSDASINELLTRAIESYESIINPIRSDTSINDLLTRAIAGYGALWLADAALPYIVGGVIFLLWLGFTVEMFIF